MISLIDLMYVLSLVCAICFCVLVAWICNDLFNRGRIDLKVFKENIGSVSKTLFTGAFLGFGSAVVAAEKAGFSDESLFVLAQYTLMVVVAAFAGIVLASTKPKTRIKSRRR